MFNWIKKLKNQRAKVWISPNTDFAHAELDEVHWYTSTRKGSKSGKYESGAKDNKRYAYN